MNMMPQWMGQTAPQAYGVQPLQKYEIPRVNGEEGARAFKMLPNSEILLLDKTEPILWMVSTDSAGYQTILPFDLTPHQIQQQPTLNDIIARLEKLEAQYAAKPRKHNNTSPVADSTN